MTTHRVLILALSMGIVLSSQASHARTAREILDRTKELERTTRHWTDRSEHVVITVFEPNGRKRRREMNVYAKRFPDDEIRTLSNFLAPPDVKGTAFLQLAPKDGDQQQWLYLPEFRRIRPISGGQRNSSFMGTDFTYQDLETLGRIPLWSESDAPTKLLGEEQLDGVAVYQIELRPRSVDVAYGRILLWIEEERLVPRKLDLFDRNGKHVKTQTLNDVRDVGRIPTPHQLVMSDLLRGSKTVVEISRVRYDTGLSDDLFTKRYLERSAP